MKEKEKLEIIKNIVAKEMQGVNPSHDFDHVLRVYNLCLTLAKYEKNVNLNILKLAALLHDISRLKEDLDNSGNTDHAIQSAKRAEEILKELNYPKTIIKEVKHCILTHRFRSKEKPKTIEAKILFDADKLDALGAIGIARSFSWVGEAKAKLYYDICLEEYKKKNLTENSHKGRIKEKSMHSANLEFELKLKKLPEMLFTKKAREIASKRIKYMYEFFEKLKNEITLQPT